MVDMNQPHQQAASEIHLEKEVVTGSYRWFTYAADVTGLRLICLEDLATGTIATTSTANPEKRTAAHKAWAGARQSRAPGMPCDLFHQMAQKATNPDHKLAKMFPGY